MFRATDRFSQAAVILVAVMVSGCGGSDSTSPEVSIPQIAGRYTLSEAIPAATCSPNQPPPGGIVILTPFSQSYAVRIEQSGTSLKLIDVDFPDDPETGTINTEGAISIVNHIVFEETPREGNRVFFVDLTLTRDLRVQKGTSTISGSGSAVNIFHEGLITNPVYATCSRQWGSTTLTRLAG